MKPLLCLVAVFAASVASTLAQGPLHTDFYPLKKGHRWTYRAVDSTSAEPRKVVIEVEREEPFTRKTKKGKEEVVETFTGFLVKASSAGKTTTDHVVVLEEGIYRIHTGGTAVTPPILFFKLPLKTGDTWECNSTSGNAAIKGTFTAKSQTITVPAGKFDAFVVAYRDINSPVEVDYWFVRGIGMIKQRVKLKNSEITLELENFAPAK